MPTVESCEGKDADGIDGEAGENKYFVKNKDTGEVYDIRDLSKLPSDTYSIFPNDFLPPQEVEVRKELNSLPLRSCTHLTHPRCVY